MQAIIEGNLYEIEPAVKVILDRVMTENAELKRENKRLEEGYQKSIGVIAATDCVECKAEPVKHGHSIERVSDLISKQAVREALLKKGQATKRYKLGETWELNWFEIEDALSSIPIMETEVQKMRLIDADLTRDEVSQYITTWKCKDCLKGGGEQFVMAVDDIAYLPTVDAEPVKHGHWIEKKNRIICSNCGRKVLYNSDYLPQTTHFCYNCGAKMSNGKDFDFNNSLLRSWK